MRVLHLSSEKAWRGGEQQIAYLVGELKSQGVECHVMCKRASAFSKYCREMCWPFQEAVFRNSLDIISAIKILKYCLSNKIDIVHMHGSGSHGVGVLSATLGNKSRFVLSRRVDFPLKSNFLSRWKYNHQSIGRILCVSNKIREIVERGIDRKGICETVYSGIDLKKFESLSNQSFLRKKYGLKEDTTLVGNTSALADHKDYFTYVDTAERVLQSGMDACFFIFGKGPLEEEIKNYVAQKKLTDRIIFTGFLENIYKILPELDVFLMTSKTEGLGTSLLDAMAASVPIVATRAGGIPEIVVHGQTGLISEVKDSEGLATQVIEILSNDDIKKDLVECANEFVKKFDKRETARSTLKVYREILKEDG